MSRHLYPLRMPCVLIARLTKLADEEGTSVEAVVDRMLIEQLPRLVAEVIRDQLRSEIFGSDAETPPNLPAAHHDEASCQTNADAILPGDGTEPKPGNDAGAP